LFENKMRFIAKTLYGLEDQLAGELSRLGAKDIAAANRAVLFSGDKELMYRVNYLSRTALSVLMQIREFKIRSADDLYQKALGIEWDNYLDVGDTFAVVPVVQSHFFNHTGFAGLRLKDSIADYFRKKRGRRPSVNPSEPSVLVNLHISNDSVTVSFDSSVVPLFKRGYRQEQAAAPLNEVLAAGMILISGWNAGSDLTDPMCGSGTIPVEAGMIACNIPAGKFRQFFGFQKWKDYDKDLFNRITEECNAAIKESPVKVSGSDISKQAADQAVLNVRKAGLDNLISIEVKDFRDLKPAVGRGSVFINPPYGERLSPNETDSLYEMIGSSLKHNFPGHTAWIISSNKESLKHIGLKPKEKHILYNGALECLFLKYELYSGSRKAQQL
jgi:putative N6-adenine-specific DNA methylase